MRVYWTTLKANLLGPEGFFQQYIEFGTEDVSIVLDENLHVVVFTVAELNFEDILNYPWLGVYGLNWLMYVVRTFDLRCENAVIYTDVTK